MCFEVNRSGETLMNILGVGIISELSKNDSSRNWIKRKRPSLKGAKPLKRKSELGLAYQTQEAITRNLPFSSDGQTTTLTERLSSWKSLTDQPVCRKPAATPLIVRASTRSSWRRTRPVACRRCFRKRTCSKLIGSTYGLRRRMAFWRT